MTLRKAIYWCFNFHTPTTWIAYISGGDDKVMYDHFIQKWLKLCMTYSAAEAFLRFYTELSKDYQDKLEEYIENNYKP